MARPLKYLVRPLCWGQSCWDYSHLPVVFRSCNDRQRGRFEATKADGFEWSGCGAFAGAAVPHAAAKRRTVALGA